MQSPLVVALRALIMLAALVACPVLALQGVKPPERTWEILRTLQARAETFLKQATQSTPAPPLPAIELPLRQPVLAVESSPTAPVARAIPVEYQAPPWTTTGHPGMPPAAPLPSGGAAPPMHSPPAPAAMPDPFQALQERLRQLGATSYMLETWGSGGELYRFTTDVAVHNDPNYHRNFQAIQASPLAAIQDVLAQVEAWRSSTPR